MRACQKCGAEVEKSDRYCPECGIKIEVVKEARQVTLWTVFKIVGTIILLIIFINLIKRPSSVGVLPILILLALLVYACISFLNLFLKKIFNIELSKGVKVAAIFAIAALFLVSSYRMSSISSVPKVYTSPAQFRPVEGNDMNNLISRLNDAINTRDNSLLMAMMEEGVIAPEVAEDIRMLMDRKDFEVRFKFQGQNVNDNRIDAKVIVIIKTLYEERVEGVQFFFERTDRGWTLVTIEPKLSNIKISKSFEEETAYNLKKISKQEAIIQETDINAQVCVTEPGKAIYGGSEKCCGGLKAIWGNENAYGECQCTGEDNNCGGAMICAPCGNGMCEKEYSENRCSCPEDC